MTANTLTALIPKAIDAMQQVLYEQAPLPAMVSTLSLGPKGVALNESATIPLNTTVTGADRTPAMVPTEAAGRTATTTTISITKDRKFAFQLSGDDEIRLREVPGYIPESIMQAMRSWRNEMHSDIASLHTKAAGYYSADTSSSGAAVGTAATTPFGSDISLAVDLEKLLNDSLAPAEGRVLLIDSSAKAALGKLSVLTKVNEAGTDALLRQAVLGRLAGFDVMWAHDIKRPAIGTFDANYQTNGAASAGATSIVVDTGTGTFVAGDVITFAGDANKYVIAANYAGGAGTITITSGLVNAVADNIAITGAARHRCNLAFHRDAFAGIVRPSAMPEGGDSAAVDTVLTDPRSGLSCRLLQYKGYGLRQWELQAAWGFDVVRAQLLKKLLG